MVLVALSGMAALVYESLWMRSFGLIFGGTTQAVAMVLAVYMAGLAAGGSGKRHSCRSHGPRRQSSRRPLR